MRWPDRCDGHSLGTYLEARRKQAIQGAVRRYDSSVRGFADPDLLDIESHSPTLTREGFYDSLAVRVQPWTQVTVRGRAASV